MSDFSVDPQALDTAAGTAGAEAGTVKTLTAKVNPPPASACGTLLENAFGFTFPAATDAARAYIEAMAGGAEAIGETLAASARLYRTTEDEAIRLADTIWEDI